MKIRFFQLLFLAAVVMLACNLPGPLAEVIPAPPTASPTAEVPTILPLPPTFTPTPTPAATDTPVPLPSDTPTAAPLEPEVTRTPEPEVILSDDFSSAENAAWTAEEFTDPNLYSVTVVDGRILLETRFQTEDEFGVAQITYHDLPQNFAVTVEIEFTAGSSEIGEAGILVRLTPDLAADYEFTISPDGQYAIYKYDDDGFTALVDYTPSSAIRTEPGAINQLTVVLDGASMTLFINGVDTGTVLDDDIHGAWLGLVVYNFDETGAGAYFDNLLVTNLAQFYADPPPVP